MKKKTLTFVCMLFIILFVFPCTAYADTGPKPELTITVENPPTEEYYLDLLIQKQGKFDNISNDNIDYDKTMLQNLKSLQNKGWFPAYSGGTYPPMWGELIGVTKGKSKIHKFGYLGLPDTYRIIVVTKSGEVHTSEITKRLSMKSSITYNYKTQKISSVPIWVLYIVQFFMTCIPTLIIEGIVLLLFRFKLKENWKPFILMNIGTQILLTVTMGVSLIKDGTIQAYMIMLPMELLIVIVEIIVSVSFLHGYSKKRKIIYALCANIASWVIGFILISPVFWMIGKL